MPDMDLLGTMFYIMLFTMCSTLNKNRGIIQELIFGSGIAENRRIVEHLLENNI